MTKSPNQSRRQWPRGLATLEMVLVLPILLFVMALMIIIGVGASWKIRSLSVAREAVWGTRWPRTGFCYHRPGTRDPRPNQKYWPPPARENAAAAGNVPELNDPRVDRAVARGPLPNGNTVDADLLDPTRGLRRGSAQITRRYPVLAKMGEYDFKPETDLLDDKWRYPEMKMWSNVQRRTIVIYTLAQAPVGLVNAYLRAAAAIRSAPFRPDLRPLDRDEEFLEFKQIFGWSGGQPNFHPMLNPGRWRAGAFCSLDPEDADTHVENLLDRIQGDPEKSIRSVAQKMTDWFRNMYNRAKREYENQLNAVPPYLRNETSALQSKINQLEGKIQQLDGFSNSL